MIPLPPLFFALLLAVTDGDTIRVRTAIWQGQTVEVAVRIAGIDTPELHGKCPREKKMAIEAKAALFRMLPIGTMVELRRVEEEKYAGRVLADIRTMTGVDVAGHLLKIGLAHSYHGKKKRGWC